MTGDVRPARRRSGGEPHVVVIGGGIAGLAAAHALLVMRPATRVTVLEGSTQVGGKLRLGEVAGLAVDLGAESILNRRAEGVDLARAVGLGDAVVHPERLGAGIWTRGRVWAMPPTLMGIPTDLDALARSGVVTRAAVGRARAEALLPPADVAEDVAVGRLVERRLGRRVRDYLVEPMLGGVYAGRSDRLSLHATVPQLVAGLARHRRVLNGAAWSARVGQASSDGQPVFAGLVGGVGGLAPAVSRDVERRGGVVRSDATVRAVRRTPGGWSLDVGPARDTHVIEADCVIVATPAAPASRLLREAAPGASMELGRIEYASMALVTVAVRTADVTVDLPGSGFLVPPVDGHVIKAATFSSSKWSWQAPGGGRGRPSAPVEDVVVLRCSIGRQGEEPTLQRDDSELVHAAMMDLRDAVGLRAPLVDVAVTRWGGALPQYAVGHLDRVRRIRAGVAEVPGLAVCGAALDGVGIPAVVATGQEAARLVTRHLAAQGSARGATMGP